MKAIVPVLMVALLAGCASLRDKVGAFVAAGDLPSVGQAGDFASALARINDILAGKKAVDPLAGLTFKRTYYVKGVEAPASDITWREEYFRLYSAEQVVPPTAVPVEPPATDADAAAVDAISNVLGDLGLGDLK